MGATVDNIFHVIFYYQVFVDTIRFLPRPLIPDNGTIESLARRSARAAG